MGEEGDGLGSTCGFGVAADEGVVEEGVGMGSVGEEGVCVVEVT